MVQQKMDPAVKAKWVAALRSGKYRQGTGRLATLKNKRYSYCCLGVLCNLDTETKRVEVAPIDYEGTAYRTWFETDGVRSDVDVPPALKDRVGLATDAENTLIDLNDNQGKSFAEIADWIETNL